MNLIQQSKRRILMSLVSFILYGKWHFKDAYNAIYQGLTEKNGQQFIKIFKDAFGDEFPESTDGASFVTLSDLKNMVDFLNLEEGDCFVDLACGRGGPGMWIATKTRANIKGVDISEVAVHSAKQRIQDFGLSGRAEFKTGTFYDTGFDTESFDGAISIDSFWLAPDRNKALDEIARILKPNARFVFTTWDGTFPFMPVDHKKNLVDSGFEIEIYKETEGWKERQLAFFEGILKSKELLVKEMGNDFSKPLIKEAKLVTRSGLDKSTRIFVVAKKNSR